MLELRLFFRGLDDVAVKQCMELLRTLSLQGRTVICTIHTPADSIFRLFDQVTILCYKKNITYSLRTMHLIRLILALLRFILWLMDIARIMDHQNI